MDELAETRARVRGGVVTAAAEGVVDALEEKASPLNADAERIERLLDELHSVAGPVAWPRVEELVAALMRLHGAALQSLLDIALTAADAPALERVCDDSLVSGLLTLHGIHPLSPHARVERALKILQPSLDELGCKLEIIAIDGGLARFRATGDVLLERANVIRRAASVAADQIGAEIDRVEIEGLPVPPASDLISADRLVRGGAAR
jgi:hypothetical protein